MRVRVASGRLRSRETFLSFGESTKTCVSGAQHSSSLLSLNLRHKRPRPRPARPRPVCAMAQPFSYSFCSTFGPCPNGLANQLISPNPINLLTL